MKFDWNARPISDYFVCDPDCCYCLGGGTVCEDHPLEPWAGTVGDEKGCPCGAAGMPCQPKNRNP